VWCRQQNGGHGSWNPHKECVTTHLQNHTAPKTDSAQAVGSLKNFYWRNSSRQIARHLAIQHVTKYFHLIETNTFEWVGGFLFRVWVCYRNRFVFRYKRLRSVIFLDQKCYASKRYSRETFELPIVQILVLVARSLTENTTEDDRSGERFHVAA